MLLAISITVTALVGVHKHIKLQHYHDIREYYEEQLRSETEPYIHCSSRADWPISSLRHSLFALHNAASERFADERA